jgi:RNA recognition motif-containing protein
MSVDPFTGRNPSYCFIELSTSIQAQAAMEQLNGKYVLGRPVKINLAKSSTARHRNDYIHDRWHSTGARSRFDGATDEGRRLYVGGLPRMPDQATVNVAMRELFAGWEVDAVSKITPPHESKKSEPGNHHYVFVDFKDPLEAADAVKRLDGTYKFGGKLKINLAKGGQGKKIETRGRPEIAEDWNARKIG